MSSNEIAKRIPKKLLPIVDQYCEEKQRERWRQQKRTTVKEETPAQREARRTQGREASRRWRQKKKEEDDEAKMERTCMEDP